MKLVTFDLIKIKNSNRFWLLAILLLLGFFYLNLIWRTTSNIDYLTTSILFYGAISSLLWKKKETINLQSDLISGFIGLMLLIILVAKTVSLLFFEAKFLTFFPFFAGISLAMIASGFRGLKQYVKELFFTWFLFFPEDTIGFVIENIGKITVITAKTAAYVLYYFGFNVTNRGNEVLLSVPNVGEYRAIVNYSCTGIPMILLMLKLSLLLVCFFPVRKIQYFSIPVVSTIIGFSLGVIRVCIMTLVIPEKTSFDYWHGTEGSQIFSTVAIIIFSGFAYWVINRRNLLA